MKKYIKLVTRIVSLVLIIGFFIPCFTVSCASQSRDVTAIGATFGYGTKDTTISDPKFILLFLLIIPIAVLIVVARKTISEMASSIATGAMGFADFLLLMGFKSGTEKFAASYHCTVETKFGFVLNVIMSLALIGASAVSLYFLMTGKNPALPMKPAGGWTCAKCGSVNLAEYKFCTKCGSEAPAQNSVPDGVCICGKCGANNPADNLFCVGCGNKLKETTSTETASED
ncbi:MAG: zinc ribbon domain-containing protein [Lachnospiraceae bacterium]|nr:zinc ribbon domain-containing protein [Lachnospiraceae bacterium]